MQDRAFLDGEADAYHQRNHHKYAALIEKDPPLSVLSAAGIRATRVLEIGAATGWRLEEIRRRYGAECWGIEPSRQAAEEGKRLYPGITIYHGILDNIYLSTASFDLIVLSFVLHWVPREKLLATLAEVDRMLADGGHLIISDFWVPEPTKVPYHHQEGLWTYKARYCEMFELTGRYLTLIATLFDADTLQTGHAAESSLANCTILQKGDFFRCV